MMTSPDQRRIPWRLLLLAVMSLALLIAASTALAEQGSSDKGNPVPEETRPHSDLDAGDSLPGSFQVSDASSYDLAYAQEVATAKAYVLDSAINSEAPAGCTQPGLLIADTQPISFPYNANSARQIDNTVAYAYSQGHIGVANRFALFQAHDPYIERGYPTYIKNALVAHGYTYDQFAPGSLQGFNFNNYRVVLLLWDAQFTSEFVTPYQAAIPALENYIAAGGVVWLQAGFWGSSTFALPFGGTTNFNYVPRNVISNSAHPLTQGLYNPYTGNYASHGWFSGLPAGATALATESQFPTRYTMYEYRPTSACPTLTPTRTVTGTPPTSTHTRTPTNTPVPIPAVWCVDSQGRAIGPQCAGTAGTAFLTIQEAIDVARPGDEIRIAAGMYQGTANAVAVVDKAVKITGGYAGGAAGWTTPGDPNSTRVQGGGVRKGFEIAGALTVPINNLRIENGGIRNDSGTVAVDLGVLLLRDGGTSNGHFNVAAGAELQVGAVGHSFDSNTTVTGPGFLNINGGVALTINGSTTVAKVALTSGQVAGPGTLEVTQVFSWTAGTMQGTGQTNILAGATLDISGGSPKALNARTINNAGTTNWRSTLPTLNFSNDALFNNTGLVDLRTSIIMYGTSGTNNRFINTGTIRKPTDVGSVSFYPLGAGMIVNNSSIISVPSGILDIYGGTVNMLAGSSVTGSGFLTIGSGNGGGTLNVTGAVSAQKLGLNGGTIDGPGNLSVTQVFSWTAGTMQGTGQTNIPPGARLDITGGSPKYLNTRTLNNAGTTEWRSTFASLGFANNAVFNNTGLFEVRNDLIFSITSGSANVFSNTGTILKPSDAGTPRSHIVGSGFAFNNSGIIDVQTDSLNLYGGTFNMLSGASITGAGFVLLEGSNGGGKLYISGPTTARKLGMIGGYIDGPGDLTVTEVLSWTQGIMQGVGQTNIAPGATMDVSSSSAKTLSARTLNNAGTTSWRATSILNISNDALFNNSGLFDSMTNFQTYGVTGTNNRFTNAGTLRVGAGVTTRLLGNTKFTNAGTLDLTGGAFSVESGTTFTNSGGTVALNSSTFTSLYSPTTLLNGLLRGTGTVNSHLINGSSISPDTSPGIITSTTYTQYTTGTLSIDLGGLAPGTQHDQLRVTGAANLAGSLNLTLVNGYVPQVGDSFTIMTYGSRTDAFSGINTGCTGGTFSATYNQTSLVITVLTIGGPVCTPTPTPTALPATPTRTSTPPVPSPTPTACTTFSDVPVGSTFYPFVTCLVNLGIVNGYPDCTFRPANNVTRGQLSKIVSLAANFTDPTGTRIFEDVAPGSTFYDYVQRLANRSIIGGYACGGAGEPCVPPGNRPYFRPSANATRGQISKIVSNAAGFSDQAGAQLFEDVQPGSTFYDFAQRLANRGVINGYACGGAGEPCVPPGNRPYFRPSANATRGQVSKIVANTFYPGCQP